MSKTIFLRITSANVTVSIHDMTEAIFIRHGETLDNAQGCIPSDYSPLSPAGRKDMESLRALVSDLSPRIICYGTSLRAKQSATILSDFLRVRGYRSPIFDERRLPSLILGKSHAAESVRQVIDSMRSHATNPLWHHSDEENYSEFVTRTARMLTTVTSMRNAPIVVITHAGVMKALSALVSSANNALERFLQIEDSYTVRSAGVLRLTQAAPKVLTLEHGECFLPRNK